MPRTSKAKKDYYAAIDADAAHENLDSGWTAWQAGQLKTDIVNAAKIYIAELEKRAKRK